jgi:hypothetical protein
LRGWFDRELEANFMLTPFTRLIRLLLPMLALSLFGNGVASAAIPSIKKVTFEKPSNTLRFYHLRVALSPVAGTCTVISATVNGVESAFVPMVDSAMWQNEYAKGEGGSVNSVLPADKPVELCLRFPWTKNQPHSLAITFEDGKGGEGVQTVSTEATAPRSGGSPFPGWTDHRLLVLSEDYGIARRNEPVTLFLSAPGATVHSWEDELRVASFNPASGESEEIPSQVLFSKRLRDTSDASEEYTTCQIAFLAKVPAHGKVYYLIFFGNPQAEAPEYASDLSLSEDAQGMKWIENSYYRACIDQKSGQVRGLFTKVYGQYGHPGFLNDKYTVHYNPDAWVRGRSWSHTSDWNPPPNMTLETGPVATVVRRWGPLPWVPEIDCQVVYTFFSQSPYFLVSSTLDVKEDIVVNALRNEEVVLHPETEIDHVAWRTKRGEVRYKPAELESGLSRGMLGIIDSDAPYVGLVREKDGFGVGAVRLKEFAGSRGADPPVVASNMTILADYGWQFRYWSRSLVYPWGDKVPDVPHILNADTYYSEQSAYCLFPVYPGVDPTERLGFLENLHEKLAAPLRVDKQGAGPW